jgi:hypothetical protein
VSPYLGRLARCPSDPNPLLRRQTLALLTNLLRTDFVKWQRLLLFGYLTALSSDFDDIKSSGDAMLPSNPKIEPLHDDCKDITAADVRLDVSEETL